MVRASDRRAIDRMLAQIIKLIFDELQVFFLTELKIFLNRWFFNANYLIKFLF